MVGALSDDQTDEPATRGLSSSRGVTMPGRPRPIGRTYRRNREAVLDLSDLCGICKHPGARQVDEIVPRSLGGDRNDPLNLQPAHGGGDPKQGLDNPCPTCGRRCNQSRGNRPLDQVVTKRNHVRSRDW